MCSRVYPIHASIYECAGSYLVNHPKALSQLLQLLLVFDILRHAGVITSRQNEPEIPELGRRELRAEERKGPDSLAHVLLALEAVDGNKGHVLAQQLVKVGRNHLRLVAMRGVVCREIDAGVEDDRVHHGAEEGVAEDLGGELGVDEDAVGHEGRVLLDQVEGHAVQRLQEATAGGGVEQS